MLPVLMLGLCGLKLARTDRRSRSTRGVDVE
jgi:hypothetical protein